MLENVMKLVKKAKEGLPEDWLQKAKEIQEIAIHERQAESQRKFEKLPRLDLRTLKGTEEEPATLLVKALSNRRSVKTDRMTKPMDVFDAEILASSVEEVAAGKYAIWENTTVLANEMQTYAGEHGVNGNIQDKTFIVAYYGRVPNKKGQEVYIFRVIPYEKAD